MKINEIIKEKRKEQKLTQEQVAEYLGVSTPAVNKWEKGNTYPDITILPALARLLKVDLNTLLSFNEELSDQEIGHFINELVSVIQDRGFSSGFETAMTKIQEYPNCDKLICTVAMVLEGSIVMFGAEEHKGYEGQIEKLYERVASSEDVEIRNQANFMLIAKYMEREEYEKAQTLIDSLPKKSVDKEQIQANLYVKQGKLPEAADLLERKLMSAASEIQSTLILMMEIAVKENKEDAARHFADVSEKTAKLYDLWNYNAYMAHFQLAVAQKNRDQCIGLLKEMFVAMQEIWDIGTSPLYRHIKQKVIQESFGEQMMSGLITAIQKDETFAFLQSDPEFLEIINVYKK